MEPQTQTLFNSEPSFPAASRQDKERAMSGARWFYWVAALSLITSIISLLGGRWGFFASLGVTQFIDAVANLLARRWGGPFQIVAIVFDMLAAGVFALIGYFATQRKTWAFIVGMALYALDALVFVGLILLLGGVSFPMLLTAAFHAYVLYSVYGGYKACTRIPEVDRNLPPPPPLTATPV